MEYSPLEIIRSAKRVCFFAHFDPRDVVAPHVIQYLKALKAEGFSTVLISTSNLGYIEIEKAREYCTTVIIRENYGLDFGGWIEACGRFMPLKADFLLLANDSVYAPIGDFSSFFRQLTSTSADFYGVIESFEYARHLQSWFLLLRPRAYESSNFRQLMMVPVPLGLSKADIIQRYEIGFTRALNEELLRYHAAYSPARNGWIARNRPFNASHILWRHLIRDKIPFIKIELLRDNPHQILDVNDWAKVVESSGSDMAPFIEEHLAQLSALSQRQESSREYWWRSIYDRRSSYWPETREMVIRDHNLRRAVPRQINCVVFLVYELIGRLLRTLIRFLNDWRNYILGSERNNRIL